MDRDSLQVHLKPENVLNLSGSGVHSWLLWAVSSARSSRDDECCLLQIRSVSELCRHFCFHVSQETLICSMQAGLKGGILAAEPPHDSGPAFYREWVPLEKRRVSAVSGLRYVFFWHEKMPCLILPSSLETVGTLQKMRETAVSCISQIRQKHPTGSQVRNPFIQVLGISVGKACDWTVVLLTVTFRILTHEKDHVRILSLRRTCAFRCFTAFAGNMASHSSCCCDTLEIFLQ